MIQTTGETNKGITHNTYNSYRRSKGLPIRSVKYITNDEVRDIYYNNYFKASGADRIKIHNLLYMSLTLLLIWAYPELKYS